MSWRRWPWIEEGVLPLLISTMRLCWIWPWLLMLSRWLLPAALQPVLPLWNVALLLIGGAATTHALPVDRQRPRRARLLAAAIGLAAVALTLWLRLASDAYALWDLRWLAAQGVLLTHWGGEFSPSFLVLILAASLWLRGMLDNPAPTHDDVWRAFIRGFVALTLLLIAGRIDPAGPPASTARWLVLFFAVGMAALALAGLRLARNTRQKDALLLVNRYWLSTILTVTLILLGVGLLLGLLITPGAVAWLFGWTRVVASWIGSIIGYVFYGIAYVLFLFLTPLIAWVQARMGVPEPMELSGGLQQQLEDTLQRRTPVALPPALDESLRWLGLAGALAVVALAFALALYALRRRKEEEIDETREIILTSDLLRDQAAELWRRWRDRLRRSAASDDPFLSLAGEEPLRRAVRAVYQEFLAAMMRLGAPRFPRQTPAAYAHEAASTLPGAASALERLTAAYVAARYDPRPPAAEDALAAQAAWAEIQAQLAAQATSPNGGGEPARE